MKNRQTDNCEKTLPQYRQKNLLLILPEIFTTIFTFSKGFFFFLNSLSFNPKEGGGGSYVPTAQEIACHFSQDHARVL